MYRLTIRDTVDEAVLAIGAQRRGLVGDINKDKADLNIFEFDQLFNIVPPQGARQEAMVTTIDVFEPEPEIAPPIVRKRPHRQRSFLTSTQRYLSAMHSSSVPLFTHMNHYHQYHSTWDEDDTMNSSDYYSD